jgi:hypothetical protein
MAPESEHEENHPTKTGERQPAVDQLETGEAAPQISQGLTFSRPQTIPNKLSAAFSNSDRGSRQRLANGLQQQKGNAFVQRLVVNRAPAPPTMAQQMEKEANQEEAQVAIAPPPRVAEMSTINDAEQARLQITKIEQAQRDLFQAHAAAENEKKEAGSSYSGVEAADKKINESQGFIDKNEEVQGTLQGIVDLSVGAATPVSTGGGNPDLDATVGANMRLSTFSSLFINLERDFARLQGIVGAFLAQHPNVSNEAGSEGGANLGTAVATGGKANTTPANANTDVQNAERRDPVLLSLVDQFKQKLDTYTSANNAQLIDNQVRNSGMKTNELRTLAADVALGTQRPDTPDEATAKADIVKINSDLAGAKQGLDQIEKVFKLAVQVAGMPALGGAAAAEAGGAPSTVDTLKSVASKGTEVTKTLTNVDIEDEIKTSLAKVLTDYTSRMNSANGKLEASQYLKTNLSRRIDMEKVNAAKTEVQTAFDLLHQAVSKAEQQKEDIRTAADKLTKYQAAHGGAKGGVDIASITQSLGEVTIFIEQAKATKEQGTKEKALADEMVKRRKSLAGDYNAADPNQPGGSDLLGNQRIALAEKERVFYDCDLVGDRFFYKMNPIRFELWTDKVTQTPDASSVEVDTLLKQIDEYLETAEGFRKPLQAAMFGE